MNLRVVDLGRLDYAAAHARQLAEVDARKSDESLDDLLLLVEHPHVITVGRSRAAAQNVLVPGDVPVVEIERGGDATYHGPGQAVVYPILRLRESERDLHRFLRNLEEAMILTCARFEVKADREPGKTGVWLTDRTATRRKIASIGIACRRWITFHGIALNVSTDLAYFSRINPCGFDATVMTSLSHELSRAVDLAAVQTALATDLATTLNRTLR